MHTYPSFKNLFDRFVASERIIKLEHDRDKSQFKKKNLKNNIICHHPAGSNAILEDNKS